VIWLALRRHRTNLLIVLGIMVVLGAWMSAVAWQFHTAPVFKSVSLPGYGLIRYRRVDYGPRLFQLTWQVTGIHALLLALPCVAGVLLGGPLVAGEYDDGTNRLAWTQGVGRTRWFLTKWVTVGIPLLALTTAMAVGTHLWSFHVIGATQADGNIGSFSNSGRMQAGVFPVSGLVPVAYTLFAFALGSALGALVRRTTWAVVGTFVLYGLALAVMTTTVRPLLAPQLFLSYYGSGTASEEAALVYGRTQAWLVSEGYRFHPGYTVPPGGSSLTAVVARCNATSVPDACLIAAHVDYGGRYISAAEYWRLQWREAALYLAASVLLLALGWWAVRRWRT
jgi:hypothetical protein